MPPRWWSRFQDERSTDRPLRFDVAWREQSGTRATAPSGRARHRSDIARTGRASRRRSGTRFRAGTRTALETQGPRGVFRPARSLFGGPASRSKPSVSEGPGRTSNRHVEVVIQLNSFEARAFPLRNLQSGSNG